MPLTRLQAPRHHTGLLWAVVILGLWIAPASALALRQTTIYLRDLVNISIVFPGGHVADSTMGIPSSFGPKVKTRTQVSIQSLWDACAPLPTADRLDQQDSTGQQDKSLADTRPKERVALVPIGPCAYDEMVRNLQQAGFAGAIVYDAYESKRIFRMDSAGDTSDIRIWSLLVSSRWARRVDILHSLSVSESWLQAQLPNFDDVAMTSLFRMRIYCILMVVLWGLTLLLTGAVYLRNRLLYGELFMADQVETAPLLRPGDITNHLFHQECLEPWVTRHTAQCPLCRRNLLMVVTTAS
ncbi:uncharacterized protein BJ171DRAFT_568661 [Polychytrium aggregatum]|uniref:uncharacterized protein n=1 Tax=Polychytrium aggregatum TaxID=110093 RepID=UPI0022FEE46C|nr:uncharacterized protein BJ171DRAFT_568661 [Polychytrium aggregatum]KAI9203863.1 hypothetical protein BJ171DRAFT_568661 [Polychytrium aggregatum]